MMQTQQKKVIIDGVLVQTIIQHRTKTDTKRIKELIPEEMWPEVFLPQDVEQMRIG